MKLFKKIILLILWIPRILFWIFSEKNYSGLKNKSKIFIKYLFFSIRDIFDNNNSYKIQKLNKKNLKMLPIWNHLRKLILFQLNFISVKNYLITPVALATYNNINVKSGYKISKQSIFFDKIETTSNEIYRLFNSKSLVKDYINWFSNNASAFQIGTKNFEEILKTINIVEFGAGSGLNAILNSQISTKKIYIYDLPEVLEIQKRIHNFYYQKSKEYFELSKFEYFHELKKIETEIYKKKYCFISYWGFSETPISLRDDFFKVLYNSEFIIIASNKIFLDVNNDEYFEVLSKRLNQFNYEIIDVPQNSDNWSHNHKYHIFYKKNLNKL